MSYSTKLMLTVLRDHPEGVRCALLDSVLPPEANWDEEAPANILAVLDAVLAAAREDPALASLGTELRPRFLRLLAAANAHPLAVRIAHPVDKTPLTVRLDGAGLMNCVYTALESAGAIRRLPLTLDAACRGDVQVLAPLLEEYLASSQGNAIGMRLAVWCNEEFPFERPARMLHPAGLPPELRGFVQTAVTPVALESWPRGRPGAVENESVASDVPVLIAAGEFDPDTPVRWARGAAAHLPRAQLLEFAGLSHVPLFTHPEAARILKAFLADPHRRPDPGSTGTRPGFLPPP
jgi:pimeloyl-ACP methyl ester carboxylesterase